LVSVRFPARLVRDHCHEHNHGLEVHAINEAQSKILGQLEAASA